MNERIKQLAEQATREFSPALERDKWQEKFAELIMQDMHRKVIASILITDVVMEEKGLTTTSEDYIRAINKDFGVEE
jgi:transposase-like protein